MITYTKIEIPLKTLSKFENPREYYEDIKRTMKAHYKKLIISDQLLPPHSIEDIEAYEKENNVKIRDDVKKYVTTISSEIVTGGYPQKFLGDQPTDGLYESYFFGKSLVSNNRCSFASSDIHDCDKKGCVKLFDNDGKLKSREELEEMGFVSVQHVALECDGPLSDTRLIVGENYNGKTLKDFRKGLYLKIIE